MLGTCLEHIGNTSLTALYRPQFSVATHLQPQTEQPCLKASTTFEEEVGNTGESVEPEECWCPAYDDVSVGTSGNCYWAWLAGKKKPTTTACCLDSISKNLHWEHCDSKVLDIQNSSRCISSHWRKEDLCNRWLYTLSKPKFCWYDVHNQQDNTLHKLSLRGTSMLISNQSCEHTRKGNPNLLNTTCRCYECRDVVV